MESDPEREPENFLEAIVVAATTQDSGFTNEEIFANAGTLLLAGEDTTANTIAWAMHHLAHHREHLERIREEARPLTDDHGTIARFEDTRKLPVLDAFVDESMRLKPVAPILGAEPIGEEIVLGYRIPPHTSILVPWRHSAMSEENFTNAARFDPGRWNEERTGAVHEKRASMPFGSGPRVCPGRNLAMLQIRTVLTMVCANFEIRATGAAQPRERLAFTMAPEGLDMALEERAGGRA